MYFGNLVGSILALVLAMTSTAPAAYAAPKAPANSSASPRDETKGTPDPDILMMPIGNMNMEQPPVPSASRTRTKAFKRTYDYKFERVLDLLRNDEDLMGQIKEVAKLYEIDPIHIIGAIVGEHTYNYDSLDSAQGYYLKALNYAGLRIEFEYEGEKVTKFIQRRQFRTCNTFKDSSARWRCYEKVWNETFLGQKVDGIQYPLKRFHQTFFRPMFAGQSFGIGQLTPLTALKMNDMVQEISKFPALDPDRAMDIYQTVMNPEMSLHYTAAAIRDAIEAYREVARIDISPNPGITATLYNLGNPWERAAAYAARREKDPESLPQENYYGWLVNARIDALRALL
ncbi:DUF1402 family protein [Pseudovibrio exalbescens]|uniref:DUF1402 domain-containing protein n=1 Tax=Pseudovibrio exalbescens TaxID=197461 RepID=A0A1U7JL60_9HYPH|nr:DUF1402 family protein [Pseudovibrio exalbescens]OKL45480.1 hypothetical protein A3843_03965 [Pseudovibrio exalbescens]